MPDKKGTNTFDAAGVCSECGQPHEAALAGQRPCIRHRTGGQPCRKPAMLGQNVCGSHGGRTALAKAAGQRRDAEHRAEAAIRRLIPDNPAPITDPIATLARLGGEVDALRTAAAAALNKAFTANKASLDDFAALAVYERTVDRLVRICESLVRSNYLEREAAVDEAKVVALYAVIEHSLRLVLDVDVRRTVAVEIATGLRKLTAAS